MKVIAISGPQGSGKSTVADVLVQKHGFVCIEFSEPIETMIRALITPVLGKNTVDLYVKNAEYKDQPLPIFDVSYRDMGRKLGSEWGRALNQSIWLRFLEYSIADVVSLCPNGIVMPGLRMPFEAEWIHQQGGVVWMTQGKHVEQTTTEAPPHDTEANFSYIAWDKLVPNWTDTKDLEAVIQTLL